MLSCFGRFALCLIMSLLTGCKKDSQGLSFLPVSSGRPYEMLLVIDRDLYQRPAGRAIHDVLTSDVPGLPQHEASFRISTCPMSGFDRTFKIFRNIIVVDINPNMYTTTKFKFLRDLNASPQMIMTIQSPSEQEFSDYVYQHGCYFKDTIKEIQEKLLLRGGADEVVYPEKQLAAWTAIRYSSDHILEYIELDAESAIVEIEVPHEWINKSLGQLAIRQKYHVNVLAMRDHGRLRTDLNADTVFVDGTRVLILGFLKDLQKFLRG